MKLLGNKDLRKGSITRQEVHCWGPGLGIGVGKSPVKRFQDGLWVRIRWFGKVRVVLIVTKRWHLSNIT